MEYDWWLGYRKESVDHDKKKIVWKEMNAGKYSVKNLHTSKEYDL